MKLFLCSLLLGVSLLCQSQQLFFPATSLSDSNRYEQSVSKLASAIIPLYSDSDKARYYSEVFGFYFAKQNYKAVIQSLDSFDVNAIPDKNSYRTYGFHYRIHSMTMLALEADASKDYAKEYVTIFSTIFNSLPQLNKDQARGIYERANAGAEKQEFLNLIKKYQSVGTDSIPLPDAIELVKQWNYWQVYSKTVALAKNQFAFMDAVETANRENELLGLTEGAILSPTAKTYITNVTYLDVEKQKLIPNATIGITGSTITSIGIKPKLSLPADATVIDGTGKFLSPGFTDAHIHFFQSGGLYARPEGLDFRKYMPYEKEIEWTHLNMKDFLKRYIQAGITSVIDVGATFNFLQLRDKFKEKSFAPSVYMTGPLITTYEPEVYKTLKNDEPFNLAVTAEEGRQLVQKQLPYHPDFIKIWYMLERGVDKEKSAREYLPIVKAIIEEAHKNNLKVAVHATERITAELAVENGCDYLVHSVDDEIVSDDFVKLLKSKNVVLCPTLIVFKGYAKVNGQELDYSTNELRKTNPVPLSSLYDLKHLPEQTMINNYKTFLRNNKAVYASQDSICLANLKRMADAGIRIAAGTDAGNTGTLHATSYMSELNAMKKSGISNWQILQSATINPTYILGKEKELGSIAIGKKADLVLLNANPVDDLQNLEQVSLVINKGHIIKPDTLIKETPLALVQRQLNAYNARNLEAFLEPYAEDVEVYMFPDKLQYKGKEEMRKQYAFFKNVPDLHCEIKERIIQGNTIIDKESVLGVGAKPVEATAIYQVENNKIKKVYFLQ
jgi:imidazolonepropionase-like amidohydrolase